MRGKPGSGATGKLTALDIARAHLKKSAMNEEDWRVTLDPEQLSMSLPHLPTGSFVIDYLIGGEPNKRGVSPCPGLPKGRISQIWGHESSGKTTLALTAAATTCARGGTVLYLDWENDIVPDYAEALGVPITDTGRFELAQPNTLEDGFKIIRAFAAAGVDLIVVDSVGAAVPAVVAERDIAQADDRIRVGLVAQKWSDFLPQIKSVINRSNTHLLGISQVRANIKTSKYDVGPDSMPQGGNAWKFYAALRMELKRIKQEKIKAHNVLTHKVEERVSGGVVVAKMIKCKLSKSQGRQEIFYIRWGEGIDDARSIIEVAIAHNVIKKGGAGWFQYVKPDGDILKVQGVDKLRNELLANRPLYDALCQGVQPFLTSGEHTTTAYADEDEFEEVVDPVVADVDSYLDTEDEGEGEDMS